MPQSAQQPAQRNGSVAKLALSFPQYSLLNRESSLVLFVHAFERLLHTAQIIPHARGIVPMVAITFSTKQTL